MLQFLFRKKTFAHSQTEVNLPIDFRVLSKYEDIDSIKNLSQTSTIGVFKHSTRCPISIHVLKNFISDYRKANSNLIIYYLDLLEHRDLSAKVTETFGVIHQSPQLIIIKDGVAVHNNSHESISFEITTRF